MTNKKLPRKYYVYGLYSTNSHKPLYIGRTHTHSYRYTLHKNRAHSGYENFLYRAWRKLEAEGHTIYLRPIKVFEDEFSTQILEMRLIAAIGRRDLGLGYLLNMTNGGDGGQDINSLSPEHLEFRKQSLAIVLKNKAINKYEAKISLLKPHNKEEIKSLLLCNKYEEASEFINYMYQCGISLKHITRYFDDCICTASVRKIVNKHGKGTRKVASQLNTAVNSRKQQSKFTEDQIQNAYGLYKLGHGMKFCAESIGTCADILNREFSLRGIKRRTLSESTTLSHKLGKISGKSV